MLALVLAAVFGAQPAVPALETPDRSAAAATGKVDHLVAYRGLGTWVDIYDELPYADPEAAVRKMHAKGVQTLYLETANWRIRERIFQREAVGQLLEAAHARGIRVVAWYLPSFANLDKDYRRSMAAIRFSSPNGHRFDSFALDIEATEVRDLTIRNRRMLKLSRRVRAAVGADYTLGAIVPEAGAKYWPNFPYASVARHYDVFLPMAYFTFRTKGAAGVDRWMRFNVDDVRRKAGDRRVAIHMIGGLAEPATRAETRAFVDAMLDRRIIGASLYDFETTRRRQWRILAPLRSEAARS